jgi:hypothetical protein
MEIIGIESNGFAGELAKKFDFVHIITGPLFIPKDGVQSVSFINIFIKQSLFLGC